MEGSESARLMYLLSIAAAEQSIKVGNAYFVPDDLTQQTLVEALDRGVIGGSASAGNPHGLTGGAGGLSPSLGRTPQTRCPPLRISADDVSLQD